MTLDIVPYDSSWIDAFETERRRIAAALPEIAVRIDHNGSTSVPGLAAKPIIDIQISVARLHPIDAYASALERLGYVHTPDADDEFCPFFHRPQQWPHSHHVHVVQSGGDEERRTLAFRDYLRDHAAVAREYETLKRRLAGEHGGASAPAREAYADAKGAFIERIVAMALKARDARGPNEGRSPESHAERLVPPKRLREGGSEAPKERTKQATPTRRRSRRAL